MTDREKLELAIHVLQKLRTVTAVAAEGTAPLPSQSREDLELIDATLLQLESPGERKTYHIVVQEEEEVEVGYIPSPSGPTRAFMTEEEVRAKWPEKADAILEDARRLGYAWVT